MGAIDQFEKMLSAGRDSALLRFSLGNEYLKANQPARAAEHLKQATRLDPDYSAAWKLYGKALTDAGCNAEAVAVYQHGIEAAQRGSNRQAEKEMKVFLRRLQKSE